MFQFPLFSELLFSLMIVFVNKVALGVFQREHLAVFPHRNTKQFFVICIAAKYNYLYIRCYCQ